MTPDDVSGPIRKILLATREMEIYIKGVGYDAILIPKEDFVEVDFTRFPEDDPLRREVNIVKLCEVDLTLGEFVETDGADTVFHLSEAAARKLLEAL
jgi:hypothetical protein